MTPIVTQNENGPCPLISIINVLSLRGTHAPLRPSSSSSCRNEESNQSNPSLSSLEGGGGGDENIITSEDLMEYLGNILLITSNTQNIDNNLRLDYEANMVIHLALFIITQLIFILLFIKLERCNRLSTKNDYGTRRQRQIHER